MPALVGDTGVVARGWDIGGRLSTLGTVFDLLPKGMKVVPPSGVALDTLHQRDYRRNSWLRDTVLVSCALFRSGYQDEAFHVLGDLWGQLGAPDQL